MKKSLYGLKQASEQWYSKLLDALKLQGHNHSKNYYSLFFKKVIDLIFILVVYVDDILVTEKNLVEITNLKTFLDT